MNLTPLDVRRKQFDKGFRGYDPTEVDLFLKQLADRLEELQEETRRADERVREMESKLAHYEKVELALQEALESARETARRSEASSEEKARIIVREAELRAEEIVRDAERERHGLRQDIVRLNSRQAEAAARLRGFLMSELEVLAQFQGDEPFGFIKLQPSSAPGSLPRPPAQIEAPPPAQLEASSTYSEAEPTSPPPGPVSADVPADSHPSGADDIDSEEPEPTYEDLAAFAEPDAVDESPFVSVEDEPERHTPEPEVPVRAPLDPPPSDDASERPSSEPLTGAYETDEDGPPSSSDEEPTPRAVTGGWDLRSLVTGEERSVTASDEERDRIRRILDDLD